MNISQKWIDLCVPLTKASEGCRLEAYPDPATGGDPWTIGWGQTGPRIEKGVIWTQAQADKALEDDLRIRAVRVSELVTTNIIPQMKAALVDFAYNVGLANLESSTLLKNLNKEDWQGAADEFPRWKYANGKILPGLVIRRDRERSLFLTGKWR